MYGAYSLLVDEAELLEERLLDHDVAAHALQLFEDQLRHLNRVFLRRSAVA